MPDLRLGNIFQLPSQRISRRWTLSGTNLMSFLGALWRVVQYSQIDSIGVSGDKKGLHWYQWYDWYQ